MYSYIWDSLYLNEQYINLGARSFAINSLAISLPCYPLIWYQFTCYLEASLFLATLAPASVAISSICYKAIKIFAIQSQLLTMLICYPKLVTINTLLSKDRILYDISLYPFLFSRTLPLKWNNLQITFYFLCNKLCTNLAGI